MGHAVRSSPWSLFGGLLSAWSYSSGIGPRAILADIPILPAGALGDAERSLRSVSDSVNEIEGRHHPNPPETLADNDVLPSHHLGCTRRATLDLLSQIVTKRSSRAKGPFWASPRFYRVLARLAGGRIAR